SVGPQGERGRGVAGADAETGGALVAGVVVAEADAGREPVADRDVEAEVAGAERDILVRGLAAGEGLGGADEVQADEPVLDGARARAGPGPDARVDADEARARVRRRPVDVRVELGAGLELEGPVGVGVGAGREEEQRERGPQGRVVGAPRSSWAR